MNYRVLHVFDHSIPLHSGYTFRSRAILQGQRALGWDTVHLTSAKHEAGRRASGSAAAVDHETVDGLVFHRTQPGSLASLPVLDQWDVVRKLVPRIRELARRERVDLIHAHSPCLNGLAAVQAGRQLDLPVVYEVRAFWEDAAVDHGTTREQSPRYRATRALESHVFRRADQITCICEGLRQDIVGRGIETDRVTVIPNAVDIEHFPVLGAPDAALAASLGLEGAKVIGFIGSFYAYEGLDLLLAAMPAILARMPTARALLVGGGPREAALKEQARALGIADRVIFTGRVPHAQVPAYSSLVDVFAFPRKSMRLTETVTPLKPLEAMAQGRMVIASDVGGHRELIRDKDTGFLFRHHDVQALADAVVQAIGLDEAEREPLLRRARDFVEKERNWTVSVSRYVDVYQRAMARHHKEAHA